MDSRLLLASLLLALSLVLLYRRRTRPTTVWTTREAPQESKVRPTPEEGSVDPGNPYLLTREQFPKLTWLQLEHAAGTIRQAIVSEAYSDVPRPQLVEMATGLENELHFRAKIIARAKGGLGTLHGLLEHLGSLLVALAKYPWALPLRLATGLLAGANLMVVPECEVILLRVKAAHEELTRYLAVSKP